MSLMSRAPANPSGCQPGGWEDASVTRARGQPRLRAMTVNDEKFRRFMRDRCRPVARERSHTE
jgi:hypothetical protein